MNLKAYKTKKRKNLDPTRVEKEAYNKYIRQILKGMDPLATFRKVDFSNKKIEEEQFTEEDYLNWKGYKYKRDKNPHYIGTEEERKAWNKYIRQINKGMNPIDPYKTGKTIEEEQFTEEDLFHLRGFHKKKRTGQDISEREREAKNKYNRQYNKGMDPLASYKNKEEEFTEKDYLNFKEYTKNKQKDPNYPATDEQREARNKYQRQVRKGMDPIAPFRAGKEELTEQEPANENILLWSEWGRKYIRL